MEDFEKFCRERLRRLRWIASSVGFSYQAQQIMFSRWPESQAWEILEGQNYHLAASMVINEALLSGELEIEGWKYHPDTGLPATRHEILQYLYRVQEKRLKEKLDPSEIYPQVIMPLLKADLETVEHVMVGQGYRLPKWERPPWLREMEGGDLSHERPHYYYS